jgi:tetratricopeptide (TPR) repeat protein
MGGYQCERCGQPVPLNEFRVVGDRLLCQKCVEVETRKAAPSPGQGMKQPDPTVCARCGRHGGGKELEQLLSLPMCESCLAFFRNRPFPSWIKASFAGLVAVVLLTFAWNARFVQAYLELRQFGRAILAGDLERATALAESATARVPENAELRAIADYHRGVLLLSQDRNREALTKLEACRGMLPPDSDLDLWILAARMAVAFDDRDYDAFLKVAHQFLKAQPKDPRALGSVASAYACKYAETGQALFRQKSLEFLEKMRALDQGPESGEYEMRIRHRLSRREVISPEEFYKRYPTGWPAKEK